MNFAILLSIILASTNFARSQQSSGCETVQCPTRNNDVKPHPSRCDSFCRCDLGTPVPAKCPRGLHFNQHLKVCDLAERVRCSMEVSVSNKCQGVLCPAQNVGFAVHKPNPGDCGSYCKCNWGTPIWFKCPSGLHFNPELEVCDWPRNAGCTAENVASSTSRAPEMTTIAPTMPTLTSTELVTETHSTTQTPSTFETTTWPTSSAPTTDDATPEYFEIFTEVSDMECETDIYC
ncbi:Hypothetical predicted protein [Cloeon dipterum]|uniref:Chitin-binding type-2 domain-containing protein n=1 Tax=Cloeon dipterum TaxID=197152 RepID=A0A8S1BVS5_9INSE|nr:Hypothetical predicted protein [Cloeon dipterum]